MPRSQNGLSATKISPTYVWKKNSIYNMTNNVNSEETDADE